MFKIVFDFDNTLAYRDGMWTASIFEILTDNGYHNVDIENIRKYIQYGFTWDIYEKSHQELFNGLTWWEYHEKYFERILISNEISVQEAKRMSVLVRDKYLNPQKWFLFDDTLKLLDTLNSKGYECYILSNHTPELGMLVEWLGLNKYIKQVFNSAVIGYEKPNSHVFRYLNHKLQVTPSEIIMIGDNYISDIIGARSNGMNAILVRSQNNFNYRHYAQSLVEISPIINHIQNEL
jgi:putative hydrolase of the HAD superfamily